MEKEITNVYIYTRVSTDMQVDGFSLSAQEEKLKQYANAFGYNIKGIYSDEGKSGKNIQGRPEFQRMLSDIQQGKDGIRYILVFKLSRFGRNSSDVTTSLEFIKKYGVDLICVEDHINSEGNTGKLIINVLAAVAEIERENIREQTMAGRRQKAREGKWNGGFAPYGYSLQDGKLIVEESEAEAVRLIFDLFVHKDMGYTGVAKYLETHGIRKNQRQNGYLTMFTKEMVKKILDNPVYIGKIAYGRTKQEVKKDNPDEWHRVESKDYDLYDGIHEAIIDEDTFMLAQEKRKQTTRKLEKKHDIEHAYILSGVLCCPECGSKMCGDVSRNKKKDGTYYGSYYKYICKYSKKAYGRKCEFRKSYNEDKVNNAVAELVKNIIQNPKFSKVLGKKIDESTDVSSLEEDKKIIKKQIRIKENAINKLMTERDNLDFELKDYERRYDDLTVRINGIYDEIFNFEQQVKDLDIRIKNVEKDKISANNIRYYLTAFGQLYDQMNDGEKQTMYRSLVKKIELYKEPLENGQIIKSIEFTFPIDEEGTVKYYVDKNLTIETVCLLARKDDN